VLLVAVYRRRNARTIERLCRQAERAGGRVALWALDETDPSLSGRTLGSGPGTKLEILNEVVDRAAPAADEWVVIADDDVRFVVPGGLRWFLAIARAGGLDLAQPAHLRHRSHLSHMFTMARRSTRARWTTFVEIGPLFALSPRGRAAVLPFPTGVGMGWGLELEWWDASRAGVRLGIVDEVRIRHLAAPAGGYDRAPMDAQLTTMLRARGLERLEDTMETLGTWDRWQRTAPWLAS
jgi:hypothetical protein